MIVVIFLVTLYFFRENFYFWQWKNDTVANIIYKWMRMLGTKCECIFCALSLGGRSPNGSAVITFSGVTVDAEVSDDQHRALLTYFFSLLMWDAIYFIEHVDKGWLVPHVCVWMSSALMTIVEEHIAFVIFESTCIIHPVKPLYVTHGVNALGCSSSRHRTYCVLYVEPPLLPSW